MDQRLVTVLGGTGFLGRRVVRHLREQGFSVRIATRHADRGRSLFANDEPRITSVQCNIHDERSIAAAVARVLQQTRPHRPVFELGGPRIYSYEQLLRTVAREADLKPLLAPVPFAAWRAFSRIAELLPSPPITRNQVDLMQINTVASPKIPGFVDLGISPRPVEE